MRPFRLVVVAVMLLLFIGCEREAAFQTSLPGSDWSVVAVGGQRVSDVSIGFTDADHAKVSLPCGEVELGWVWDSDGSAMSFFVPDVATCSGDQSTVLEALAGVDAWRVDDQDVITLLGPRPLQLERLDG